MSVSINNNVSAFNAHRFLVANDASMSKSIERLSSGFRINTAADDAAGLVISEMMRTQISGLTVASKNALDGINMFKTAEKALNEIEVQLRNMRDATLHALNANGNTNTIAADQALVARASDAIDRIASQTEFAGKKLLSASSNIDSAVFQLGANDGQTATFTLGTYIGVTLTADMSASNLGVAGTGAGTAATVARVTGGTASALAGVTATEVVQITGALGTTNVTLTAGAGTDSRAEVLALLQGAEAATGALAYLSKADGTIDANAALNTYISFKSTDGAGTDATGLAQTIIVKSDQAGSNGTGIGTSNLIDTGEAAVAAGDIDLNTSTTGVLQKIDDALKMVDGLRVNLGAFQKNNLESALNNISIAKENTIASESSIRDTDMADEMVSFTKSQILTQAAQAMLTQANQAPSNILQMLR